jgi:phosphoadenosine phosphosulfate reductase
MGYKRVGCIGCPLSSRQKRELEACPKYKEAYFRAAKKRIEYRNERGLGFVAILETPEKYLEWWLKG